MSCDAGRPVVVLRVWLCTRATRDMHAAHMLGRLVAGCGNHRQTPWHHMHIAPRLLHPTPPHPTAMADMQHAH